MTNTYPLDLTIETNHRINKRPNTMSKREAKEIEINRLRETWKNRWTNSTTGQIMKYFIPMIENRQKITIEYNTQLTQLITRHGNIKSYLKKIGKHRTGECKTCGEDEDMTHIMFVCTKHQDNRQLMDMELTRQGLKWPTRWTEVEQMAERKEWWRTLHKYAKATIEINNNEQRE